MKQFALAATVVLSLGNGAAQAALLDEHNGQLYDNVTGLVWLQDADLAKTKSFGVSGIDSNGFMTWSTANSWIAAMNTASYLGHNDWMLPTTAPIAGGNNWNYGYSTDGTTDYAYNITDQDSQLSYMYYRNLGLKGQYAPSGAYQPLFGIFGNGATGGQANVGLVKNLQSYFYWSGTAYAPAPTSYAWGFNARYGFQSGGGQVDMLVAWAVRPGTTLDLAAVNPVPEPATYAILLAGLGLIRFAIRRKANRQ